MKLLVQRFDKLSGVSEAEFEKPRKIKIYVTYTILEGPWTICEFRNLFNCD